VTARALLRGVLRDHRRGTLLAAGLLGAHQAFEALVPVVVGATLDEAIGPQDAGRLGLWLAVLAVLFWFLAAAYRYGARIGTVATEQAAHDLRMRLVRRVVDPRGGGDGGRLPGELLSVATADVDAAAGIVRAVTYGTGVAVALLAGGIVLLLTSLVLGAVVLVGLPLVVWLGSRLGGALTARAAGQQERAADAAGVAADLVGGLRVLQGIGGAPAGVERYRAASGLSLRATLGASRAEAALDGSAILVGGVALAGVALVGGRLAARGEISIGELIAAAGVTQFLVGPIGRLGAMGALLARSRASAERVAAALAAPPAVTGGAEERGAVPGGPVALSLRGLRAPGLGPVDLEVEAGALLGLVVADPAAATALLRCLGREAEPADGEILAGGVPLAALSPACTRATVVVAPHDAALLAGTVLDNVRAAAAGDELAVARAVAAAAVDDVIAALPDGADTVLSDAGRSLSGGQRQRIALARALAAPAPVLVLHEPTTALDAATEARVAGALRAARAGRTTVLVTASPTLLAACDQVAVLRDGAVAAVDDHAGLLAADPAYRAVVLA
jgi:putative ABC transport system ATP-binding protein